MVHSFYIPLHNHTRRGSNFDGDIDIEKFAKYSLELGIPAVCITDHGSMSAAYELFSTCKKNGLKHLIGCELYVKEPDGSKTPGNKDYYHLTAIAISLEGYKNLCRLTTLGNIEGRHGRSKKPCLTNEQIFKHSKGLVILSGCISSELNQSLTAGNEARARKWILKYKAVFGPRLYLEMHCHKGMYKTWPNHSIKISELGKKLGVKRIITNDAHFLRKEDWFSQSLVLAVGIKATLDSQRFKDFEYSGEEYIKTRQEIFDHFLQHSGLSVEEINQALDNTVEIANNFEDYSLDGVVKSLKFCDDAFEVFRQKCEEGMYWRYPGIDWGNSKWERLNYEIDVIKSFNYPDYFLIVEDFCRFARDRGYRIGKGRGSAAGSLVAYVLGITDIDPIKHGLLFERFLNPGRKSMPDIDTDVDAAGKEAIIEHLRQRWGRYSAASIGTITKSAAGSALADAYRVSGLNSQRAIQISKQYFKTVRGVPPKIKDLLNDPSSEFYKFYSSAQEEEKKAIEYASLFIEGRERQPGVHAGGVAISDELFDFVPLTWDREAEKICTVYDKDELENMGVIKFDILGLTNLGQELEIEKLLKEKNLPIPKIDELGDYPEIYKMLRRGDTFGVFQMSEGIPTKLLKEIDANCFEDLSAVNALNRPGPLDSGSDRVYVANRKNGTPPIHPAVDGILKDTYGIMLYQEEIMMIAQEVSGYTLAEADDLRKIIGKKLKDKMPAQESKFVNGGIERGISPELLARLWNEVKAAGEYSFNKSHTYAYGYQALISAFYKCYYPAEFWAAGITVNSSKFEKSAEYITQAKLKFKVVPPSFSRPRAKCWVNENNEIVLGLANIKGIGINPAMEVEANAPYTSILDFVLRSGIGKSTCIELNNLGFFGALCQDSDFENLYKKLSYYKTSLKKAINKKAKVTTVGSEEEAQVVEIAVVEEEFRDYLKKKDFNFSAPMPLSSRNKQKVIETEINLLGTVISLDPFEGISFSESHKDVLVGVVVGFRPYQTKRGDTMAFLSVQDANNEKHDITVFADKLGKYQELILSSQATFSPLLLNLKWGEYRNEPSAQVESIYPVSDVAKGLRQLNEYAKLLRWYKLNPKIVAGIVVDFKIYNNNAQEIVIGLSVAQASGKVTEVLFLDREMVEAVDLAQPLACMFEQSSTGFRGIVHNIGSKIINLRDVQVFQVNTIREAKNWRQETLGLNPVVCNGAVIPVEWWR